VDSRLRLVGARAKATLFVQRSIRRVFVDVRKRIWCDGASRGQHHRRRWRHPGWQSGCAGKARFGSGGRGPRCGDPRKRTSRRFRAWHIREDLCL
jgi:hypothetical protein